MVAYIDVENMCWEMEQLYRQEKDMRKVKNMMVDTFKDIFDQNKKDIMDEVKKEGGL